jgi:hypothetical protein
MSFRYVDTISAAPGLRPRVIHGLEAARPLGIA